MNELVRSYEIIRTETFDNFDVTSVLKGREARSEESNLWDYKQVFPDRKLKGAEEYNYAVECLMKDVVAFFNSYGGVLISGIEDKTRRVLGDSSTLDVDDLRKRIADASGADIDLRYRKATACGLQVGVLFIPQRKTSVPASFKVDAKLRPTTADKTRRAYLKGVYLRRGPQCRPAENSAEDWTFLVGGERFNTYLPISAALPILNNNLRERDSQVYRFIGRDKELGDLWRWLSDPYALVKVVSGFGGLGKTTLARQFCEEVVASPPLDLHKLIWLTAKQSVFDIDSLQTRPASKAHETPQFSDLVNLCQALLLELAALPDEVENPNETSSYIELLIEHLAVLPCLIVIDDADSLVEEQHELFQFFSLVLNRSFAKNKTASRLIITTRQTLGAAGPQLLSLRGLNEPELRDYTSVVLAKEFGDGKKPLSVSEVGALLKVSQGSPLFCASIIRLMRLSSCQLHQAVKLWNVPDGDGEAARHFVFARELEQLTERCKRILFATALLGRTSQIELQQVTGLPPRSIRDDLVKLREYHLLVDDQPDLAGGPDIALPPGLRLLQDVMRNSVKDPSAIERDCRNARQQITLQSTKEVAKAVSVFVNRVVALWSEGEYTAALEVAKFANAQMKGQNGDVKCLVGSCYLRAPEGVRDLTLADKEFEVGYKLGCRKMELFTDWMQTRLDRSDWDGAVAVANLADREFPGGENAYIRAKAYLEKGHGQKAAGSFAAALDTYRTGARTVKVAFRERRAGGRVEVLKELRFELYDNAYAMAKMIFAESEQGIQIWSLVAEAASNYAPRTYMILEGAEALRKWAKHALGRPTLHKNTRLVLERSIGELQNIMQMTQYMLGRVEGALSFLKEVDGELIEILNKYDA